MQKSFRQKHKDWKNDGLCTEDVPTNEIGKAYLINVKYKVCGKTIIMEEIKPADEKEKVQISDKKTVSACTIFKAY